MLSYRLYQLELNNTTDPVSIQKVSGTERLTDDTATASGSDFIVEEQGAIEKSVEYKHGTYKLDNVSATVSGLAEDYFTGYERADADRDTPYKPYIFEIREGEQSSWSSNDVVFHGVVDPETVQFSQTSRRTKFKVWSWDRIIGQAGKVPGRSVVEATSYEGITADEIFTEEDPKLSVFETDKIYEGDLVEVNTPSGSRRATISEILRDKGEENEMFISTPLPLVEKAATDRNVVWHSETYNSIRLPYTQAFEGFENRDANEIVLEVTGRNGNEATIRPADVSKIDLDDTQEVGNQCPIPGPFIDFELIESDFSWNSAEERWNLELTPNRCTGDFATVTVKVLAPIDVGDDVKVYSRQAYGHLAPEEEVTYPSGVTATKYRDFDVATIDGSGNPKGLIPGIFSLRDTDQLKMLSVVVNNYEMDSTVQNRKIDRRMSFPDKLEDALRAIQRTATAFLKLVPTTGSDDLPRVTVKAMDRESATTQAAASAPFVVKEWSEKPIGEDVDSVKVTTEEVSKPFNYGDVLGWYPYREEYDERILSADSAKGTITVRGNHVGRLDLGDEFDVIDDSGTTITSETVRDLKRSDSDIANNRTTFYVEGGFRDETYFNGNRFVYTAPTNTTADDATVVDINTVAFPAYDGPFGSSSVNDNRLREIAREFYDFYEELDAKGKAVLDGVPEGLVGKTFTFDVPEAPTGQGRTVFVEKAKYDFQSEETEIEFRRGDYQAPSRTYRDVRADVPERVTAESLPATVSFDASGTITPAGATFDWEITSSTNDTAQTGQFAGSLRTSTALPSGTHDWRLTVSFYDRNGTSHSESVTGSVTILPITTNDVHAPVSYDSFERSTGSTREAVVQVQVDADGGRSPTSVDFRVARGGGITGSEPLTEPDSTLTEPDETIYERVVQLDEGHVTQVKPVVSWNDYTTSPDAFTFDADSIPDVKYTWEWVWDGSSAYDLYLSWQGDSDTSSIAVSVDTDLDGTQDQSATGNGRTGRLQAAAGIAPNSDVSLSAEGYSDTGQSGLQETSPLDTTITSPVDASGSGFTQAEADNRYVLESGDTVIGDLGVNGTLTVSDMSGFTTGGAVNVNGPRYGDAQLTVRAYSDTHGAVLKGNAPKLLQVRDENGTLRFGVENQGDVNLGGDLFLSSNYAKTVQGIIFNNTEQYDHGFVEGLVYYDRNINDDAAINGNKRGGLRLYNADDGWGTILDTQNMDALDAHFANLEVDGRILATELEVRELRFSKGVRADTVGGGKIKAINEIGEDGNGDYFFKLKFKEPHGLSEGDRILAQEFDEGVSSENNNGSKVAIVRQVRAVVQDVYSPTRILVYARNDSNSFVSESEYKYSDPKVGDDFLVPASSTSSRDSMLWYDPYGPYMDVYDGLSDFDDWETKEPRVRIGWLQGAPSLSDGTSPESANLYYGLYARDAMLEGHIVAQTGEISESVVIGGNAASDLATVSELFSGDYSDLSGTPTLGDVAALDSISSTYISDGAVVTRVLAANAVTANEIAANAVTANEINAGSVTTDELAADAVTATEIDVTNLEAVSASTGNLDVDGIIDLSSGGKITNNTNFTIGKDGLTLEVGEGGANRIVWREQFDDITSAELASAYSYTSPAYPSGNFVIRSEGDTTFRTKGTVEIITDEELNPSAVRFASVGDGVAMVFRNTTNGQPSNSELERVMGPHEAAVYAIEYADGNINKGWAETDANGNVVNKADAY